jgi:hypothetical protein
MRINLNISYCLGTKTTTNLPDLAENPLSPVARSCRPDPANRLDPVAGRREKKKKNEREREGEREREANREKKRKTNDEIRMYF